jgi:non-heme chloroperoxidase
VIASPPVPAPVPAAGSVSVGGVRLHALDWGGDGVPLVLVPGAGQSAFIFGGVAPALAAGCRVRGVSPRGHGPSDTPRTGYTVATVADEVVGFLDACGIERAVLVAHSVAGAVVSRVAAEHPERVLALVYLDGLLDNSRWGKIQGRNPVKPPPLFPFGNDPSAAERDWLRRYYYGGWPGAVEADWRARPDPDTVRRRRVLLPQYVDDAGRRPPPWRAVQAPALALCAGETLERAFPWLDAADPRRARAEAYLRDERMASRREAAARFLAEAPRGRVVEFPSHHFLFLSDPQRVIAEIRAFLQEMPWATP